MWRKKRKSILVIAGFLYMLFGVLAVFDVPGGHEEHHHTFAHNLTHIILGVVLVGITLRSRATVRQALCFAFAGMYFVIGLSGAMIGHHFTLPIVPGMIEFHAADYGVHLATALFFLALGLFKRSDDRAPGAAG